MTPNGGNKKKINCMGFSSTLSSTSNYDHMARLRSKLWLKNGFASYLCTSNYQMDRPFIHRRKENRPIKMFAKKTLTKLSVSKLPWPYWLWISRVVKLADAGGGGSWALGLPLSLTSPGTLATRVARRKSLSWPVDEIVEANLFNSLSKKVVCSHNNRV